jgi:hypothetical protein
MLASGALGRQTFEQRGVAQRNARALIHDHPSITRRVAALQQQTATPRRLGLTANAAGAAARHAVLARPARVTEGDVYGKSPHRLVTRRNLDVSDQVEATRREQAGEQRA